MKVLICIGWALWLLLSPALALGWGAQGHRLVAEFAQMRLQPSTSAAIEQLLAGEPQTTLAGISQWADEIRDTDAGKATAR